MRQHRVGIVGTVLGYLGFATNLVPGFACIVAVFWGAPLLANEYERHTNVFAWSQDTSPSRWLLAKVVVLGSLIVVTTSVITLAQEYALRSNLWETFDFPAFEASVPLALGYAAFGFTFGLVVGAVCRRAVLAMGVTLVGFVGIRMLVALVVRPVLFIHLVTPLRMVTPITSDRGVPGPGSLQLDSSYLNAAGQPVPDNFDYGDGDITQDTIDKVMHQHGIVQTAYDYQPGSRLPVFQFAELAIFLILTAIAVWVAFRTVRRA